ncbi:MAG TPA: LysE family transporter [Thermoleophilaceae bacterium]|jgi:putative LysE/RhtB family amino acid efflux pump
MTALVIGFGLGFAVAAQVGPVTLLAVRSVIRGGLAVGIAMAAGVAIVDAFYAGAGAAGAGAALELEPLRVAFGILGALVLAAIGARTLWSAFRVRLGGETEEEVGTPGRAWRTALAATASNPLTIVSWAAIFAAASTAELAASPAAAALMVAGVLAGSFAWMAALALVLTLVRRRIGDRGLRILDAASGTGILVFAGLLGWRTLREG